LLISHNLKLTYHKGHSGLSERPWA